MRKLKWIGMVVLAVALVAGFSTQSSAVKGENSKTHFFTSDLRADECTFANTGESAFFVLIPGYRLVLEGEENKEDVLLHITVLNATENVGGIVTRVVEEREWVGGELAEVSLNYFAICQERGDVFYFGEFSQEYEGGVVVSTEGSWRADDPGNMPGIIMPGTFLLGSRYFQEIAPDVALDRAEHVAMGDEFDTPAGTFTDTGTVEETSPLEPNAKDIKVYGAGVGLIVDGPLMLTDYGLIGP